jgi:ribosome modulation factor
LLETYMHALGMLADTPLGRAALKAEAPVEVAIPAAPKLVQDVPKRGPAKEGYDAFAAGTTAQECPHAEGTAERTDWLIGHAQAREENAERARRALQPRRVRLTAVA